MGEQVERGQARTGSKPPQQELYTLTPYSSLYRTSFSYISSHCASSMQFRARLRELFLGVDRLPFQAKPIDSSFDSLS